MGASIAPNGPLGPELRPRNRRFLATSLVLLHEAVLGMGPSLSLEEEDNPGEASTKQGSIAEAGETSPKLAQMLGKMARSFGEVPPASAKLPCFGESSPGLSSRLRLN